ASVSCIYGLGAPEEYFNLMLFVERGQRIAREVILRKLIQMQYRRNDSELRRGNFRVVGDSIDIFPSDQDARAIRISLFGDEVEDVREIDAISCRTERKLNSAAVYPV